MSTVTQKKQRYKERSEKGPSMLLRCRIAGKLQDFAIRRKISCSVVKTEKYHTLSTLNPQPRALKWRAESMWGDFQWVCGTLPANHLSKPFYNSPTNLLQSLKLGLISSLVKGEHLTHIIFLAKCHYKHFLLLPHKVIIFLNILLIKMWSLLLNDYESKHLSNLEDFFNCRFKCN